MTLGNTNKEREPQKKKQAISTAPQHGGKRTGAGRPMNSGQYGEQTKPIRVPISLADALEPLTAAARKQVFQIAAGYLGLEKGLSGNLRLVSSHTDKPTRRPPQLIQGKVAASFDVTASTDAANQQIDLHHLLVDQSTNTYAVQVSGDSMNRAGIEDGDLLLVQELVDPWTQLKDDTIVIAFINDSQTVKRFRRRKNRCFLEPDSDNPEHHPFELVEGEDDGTQWRIFGVVVHSIRSFQGRFPL